MVTITASTLDTLLNLSSGVPDETLEDLIDASIDLLNLFGADLPNLAGAAGSKSVSLESREAGAVKLVARAVYHAFYKGIDTSSVHGLSYSQTDLLGNAVVVQSVQTAARMLAELDVSVG